MTSKILGWITGIAALAALFFRGNMHKEKAKSAERELGIAKASEKAGDKATDALIEGLENESKPVNRGHFDK